VHDGCGALVTAAVVLAAGASTRLGEPKQLVRIGGEALLERAVRVAREAGCAPIVVVLGAEAERIRAACDLGDAVIVENERWSEGMASSIQTGIRAVGDVDGAVLMTCDQPAVTVGHLRVLMATGEVAASAYAGRGGVPAYLPASLFPALMLLRGDAGARELLRTARTVELPGGELDVDTADELAQARALFG
jgi:molybdenum cofactor cytidylyltransferase